MSSALIWLEELQDLRETSTTGKGLKYRNTIMQAGVIDEMMDDMMDSAMDEPDLEQETEEEVDKVSMLFRGRIPIALYYCRTHVVTVQHSTELIE